MEGYYPLSAYYPLLEILVLCFNAILFVLLAFLILRDWRKHRTRWGGRLYPASIFALALFF
ncbi:MAG TPA: hypothetical protein VN428_10775, partial [Bryobacteraceae bacterium]|nr:hypothetical protein [Bryobacteraceae bacterium]